MSVSLPAQNRHGHSPSPACQDPDAADFTSTDLFEQAASATICAACPLMADCLATATRLNEAHRAGTDPYGVYGCWAGWWFQPGRDPRLIIRQEATTAA